MPARSKRFAGKSCTGRERTVQRTVGTSRSCFSQEQVLASPEFPGEFPNRASTASRIGENRIRPRAVSPAIAGFVHHGPHLPLAARGDRANPPLSA